MDFNIAEKYQKILRARDRLNKIQTNNGNTISNTDSKDATEEFFNQCYHLKDWIKKDCNYSSMNDVEDFINNSIALSLACDYCNMFKHAGLDIRTRSGKNIDKQLTHIRFDIDKGGEKGFIASSKLEIIIDGASYDALDLANDCIKEWDRYMAVNGIKA